MKSKFKIVCYFIPIFLICLIGLFLNTLLHFNSTFNSKFAGFFVELLLFFSIILVFVELNNKIITVKFEQNGIEIFNFLGLKNPVYFNNKEIEGFHNSIVITRYRNYNYIYLMKGGKKIAKISNQYHKNFNDLSGEIEKIYQNLGYINSTHLAELKDIFSLFKKT